MNRFCVVLISGVVLFSSCNIENVATRESATEPNVISSTSTVSETSSTTQASSATISYSVATKENSPVPKKSWLAETLPALTEEICKKDELVPVELWKEIDGWDMYELESNIGACDMRIVLERQFGKQLERVTYGELWRYNNAGEESEIWPIFLDNNSQKQFPTVFKELRSTSDVLIHTWGRR